MSLASSPSAAPQIGQLARMITSMSDQSDLLALNATFEFAGTATAADAFEHVAAGLSSAIAVYATHGGVPRRQEV